MDDCIFCKIVRKEIPADIVYEDDKVLAFHDVKPAAPVHILVITKEHIPSMFDLTPEHKDLLGHVAWVVKEIASEIGLKSFQLLNNCGTDAGQVIFHLHFHIFSGDKVVKRG